ncbi:MAG: hypothetical protein R3C56_20325 [Pirellulaceae bacterium]
MTFKKCLGLALVVCLGTGTFVQAELRVGAAKVDVSPDQWPVLVNGGMTSRSADQIKTRVNGGRSCWTMAANVWRLWWSIVV